jgi:hypothetical protein
MTGCIDGVLADHQQAGQPGYRQHSGRIDNQFDNPMAHERDDG